MFKIFCTFLPITLFASILYCDSLTIRKTNNGPVEGIERISILGKKYYSFRGIPYAETPITGKDPYTGEEVDRRFKATVPLTRTWTEPLKVHDYGDGCIASTHFLPFEYAQSENCLFVNVFVPAGGAEKKTVLAYIHGGAFTEGTGKDLLYGPDFLVDADNIVVTFNYRVGIFGFMNLGFGEYTGNMGLKDQQTALKWIYENIEHFSGNKNEILLLGESAGGASVHYQMLNEESRKYFNRAFLLSGTSFNYYTLYEPNHLKKLQEYTGIEDKKNLIEYIKTTKSDTIAKHGSSQSLGTLLLAVPWAPTIENPFTKNAFITQLPEQIYNSDKAPVIDAMFSYAAEEFVTFNPELILSTEPLITEDWKESNVTLPFYGLHKDSYPNEYKEAIELLRKTYLPDLTNPEAIKTGNTALLSDLNFAYGIIKGVVLQVKANNKGTNKKNTFVQRISVNTDIDIIKSLLSPDFNGTAHGADVCLLFRCRVLDDLKVYDTHLKVREAGVNVNYDAMICLVKIVTNFARTGNPSIEDDTPFKSNTNPDEIIAQDITNESKISIIPNILKLVHYDVWQTIEEFFKKMKIMQDLDYCNAPSC